MAVTPIVPCELSLAQLMYHWPPNKDGGGPQRTAGPEGKGTETL